MSAAPRNKAALCARCKSQVKRPAPESLHNVVEQRLCTVALRVFNTDLARAALRKRIMRAAGVDRITDLTTENCRAALRLLARLQPLADAYWQTCKTMDRAFISAHLNIGK